MKRLFTVETLFFVALWLALMAGGRSNFLRDPGTFWHTVTGEKILETGTFIDRDPYTFTFAGDPWIPYQWLSEVGMALLYRISGLDTLLVVAVTLVAGLFARLGGQLVRRGGLHPAVAAVLCAFAVFASSSHFHVRPHLFTMIGLAITYALLCAVESGRSPASKLFRLVPFFILWTNLHGGMLGGLATLTLAVAGWILFVPALRKHWKILLAVVVLSLPTMFATPYGTRLADTWRIIMVSPELPRMIKEHAPPGLDETSTWAIIAFGAIYAFMLAGVPRREIRIVWLLPLVWFYLGMSRVRHAPLFSIVGMIAIADFFPRTRWAKRLLAKGSDWFAPPADKVESGLRWLVVPLLFVLICIGIQSRHEPIPVVGSGWAQLDPTLWPIDLNEELSKIESERSEPIPIFNEFIHGGFLIRYHPKFRTFIDDRCELFGDAFLKDLVYGEFEDPAGHIAGWEAKYGLFPYAMPKTGSGYDDAFARDGHWELVKRGLAASLYKRK